MDEIRGVDNSNWRLDMVLPDKNTFGPRDGSKLGSGGDRLFELWMLHNLIVNRGCYGAVLHCSSNHWIDRGRGIYLLEHNSGELHHPITLEKVLPDSVVLMNKLKVESAIKQIRKPLFGYELRAGLYEHFFLPEYSLKETDLNSNPAQSELMIDGLKIYPTEESSASVLFRLNKGMRWPLVSGVDPILDDWGMRCKRAQVNRPSCRTFSGIVPIVEKFFCFPVNCVPRHNGICPLDGYVTTITADHKSPKWTWSALCGRHFSFQLCPHCLRIIGESRLESMS